MVDTVLCSVFLFQVERDFQISARPVFLRRNTLTPPVDKGPKRFFFVYGCVGKIVDEAFEFGIFVVECLSRLTLPGGVAQFVVTGSFVNLTPVLTLYVFIARLVQHSLRSSISVEFCLFTLSAFCLIYSF